jgi:hypothetical protein
MIAIAELFAIFDVTPISRLRQLIYIRLYLSLYLE